MDFPLFPECFKLSDTRQKAWLPSSAASGALLTRMIFQGEDYQGLLKVARLFRKTDVAISQTAELGAVIYFIRNAGWILPLRVLVSISYVPHLFAIEEQNTHVWSECLMSCK